MNAQNVLIGAAVVFVLMRAVCEPKLAPGREIWHRIIEPRPVDVAVLAGVRFVGTASLLIGLGAAIGMCLTWWVESLNPVAMGKVANQEAIDRIRGLLTVFAIAQSALSPLGKLLSVVYVVVFAVGSIFWWSRRDVRRELKVAIEELEALAHKNKLPHEPPDERMRHVDRAIAAAHAANAGIGVIEDLYERRFQYDLARRLSPELLRDTGEPLSGARVPAILRFLISPLLWHPMKRLGRIVSTFLMIVMVPAALTIVASGDLNRAIDEKRQVLVALKGALTLEIELRPKMPPPTPPPDQDGEEEDAVAAAAFGRAFEVAWGTSLLGRSATQPEAARIDDARRSWARRQVLLESAARRDAVVVAEATSNMSPRQVLSQAVMDAALKARTGSEPATSIGELAEKTGRLARIGTKSVATAYPSWTIHDVFATATTAGFGWAVDGAIDTESTEITRLVDVVKQTLEQAAEPLIPLSRSIKLAILSQASLVRGEATANPKPSLELFITPDSVRSLKVALENVTDLDFPRRDASLSLEVVSNKDIDRAKVETALRPYVRNGRPRLDSLASYSSLFPGIGGQRAQTEQASIARALSPAWASVQYGAPPERSAREGRPLRVLKPAEVTPSAKHHLDLARSFGRLHTHHKVGGVLIGREPNNATTSLDFVDIDLSIEGRGKDEKKGLVIHLMRADGNRIVVGPYDPAVAQLALAYAADGRPVTAHAAKILKDNLQIFINFEEEEAPQTPKVDERKQRMAENLARSVEELELSIRSYNCLKNARIGTLGELVQKTEGELLKTRNFGRKSLNEIRDILTGMGLSLGMDLSHMDLPPIGLSGRDDSQEG